MIKTAKRQQISFIYILISFLIRAINISRSSAGQTIKVRLKRDERQMNFLRIRQAREYTSTYEDIDAHFVLVLRLFAAGAGESDHSGFRSDCSPHRNDSRD